MNNWMNNRGRSELCRFCRQFYILGCRLASTPSTHSADGLGRLAQRRLGADVERLFSKLRNCWSKQQLNARATELLLNMIVGWDYDFQLVLQMLSLRLSMYSCTESQKSLNYRWHQQVRMPSPSLRHKCQTANMTQWFSTRRSKNSGTSTTCSR